MAKKVNHVWGVEIGQSAIKALRCHLEGDKVVADSFDFVEYPKILSQPDAEPEVLLADALEQFTSRNDLRGCKVAVSVPGQQGLAKFFKPPPVEVKKIPDIVRYEAKQQIPFDLNDVIWDFQQMAGANIEDGYALESEVGLFAMKREAVYRALKPFQTATIEPDIIQLSPVAIYNMVAFDRFAERLASEQFDPEHPQKSVLLLSIGTDATDLIVTNGFRIWQRSMPIGGNHFTRQLSKELKLTFAKAEHLKRNAMQADDPKLVFQAMRPIFNDMHTEIQRSIGFFRQINKKAEIESILVLGNTAKLPGLQAYLNKSLGMDVEVVEKFSRLSGVEVVGSPSFKENQPSFGVVYGLCVQALKKGTIQTNLLPKEIVMDRLVASKKPWMSVAAATLLAGMAVSYGVVYNAYAKVDPNLWSPAKSQVLALQSESNSNIDTDELQKRKVDLLRAIGSEVSANSERRKIWLELMSVISGGLNREQGKKAQATANTKADSAKAPDKSGGYSQRRDFHITEIDSVYLEDVSKYVNADFKTKYEQETRDRLTRLAEAAGKPAPASSAPPSNNASSPDAAGGLGDANSATTQGSATADVSGPGWVVKLEGYHYHNGIQGDEKADFVRKNLIHYLETAVVELPGPNGTLEKFSMKEMGVSYPMLIGEVGAVVEKIGNPEFERVSGGRNIGGPAAASGYGAEVASPYGMEAGGSGRPTPAAPKPTEVRDENGEIIEPFFTVTKASFVVQFVWRERTLEQRMAWKQDPKFNPDIIPPKEVSKVATVSQ